MNAGPLGAQHLDAVRVAQVDRVGADLEEPAHLDAGDGEPSLDRLLRLLGDLDAEAPGTVSGMQPDEPQDDRQEDQTEQRSDSEADAAADPPAPSLLPGSGRTHHRRAGQVRRRRLGWMRLAHASAV